MIVSDSIFDLIMAAGLQVVIIGAGLVAAVVIAMLIQRVLFRTVVSVLGYRRSIYSTGWIGTTVHEISHLLVFWIFRVKVIEFKLFSPDFRNSNLGYVKYLPNTKNPLNSMGCLLASIAPLAIGIASIFLLGMVLVPELSRTFLQLMGTPSDIGSLETLDYPHMLSSATLGSIGLLMDHDNVGRWQFWLFVYASICVACHFAPSQQDLRGIGPGILVVGILLFIVNVIALSLWDEPFANALYLWKALGFVFGFVGLALALSLMCLSVVRAIFIPIYIVRIKLA